MQATLGLGAASAPPRPRILAFHGWRTSAAILQQQLKLSGLDVALREVADVVCMDGPHPARGPPMPDVQRFFSPPFVEWWDAVTDPASGRSSYVGSEQSLAAVESALRSAAAAGCPVLGLLGFSQGATLAGLVATMQEQGERFTDVPPIRCATLISGGIARDDAFLHLYGATAGGGGGGGGASVPNVVTTSDAASSSPSQSSQPQAASTATATAVVTVAAAAPPAPAPVPPLLRTPSCHLIGAADSLRGRSEELTGCFAAPLVLRHEQGHVVPRLTPEQRSQLLSFLATHLLQPQPQPQPQL